VISLYFLDFEITSKHKKQKKKTIFLTRNDAEPGRQAGVEIAFGSIERFSEKSL